MKSFVLLIISVIAGNIILLSQPRIQYQSLKKGDIIKGIIVINSNSVYQKGQQFVNIGTRINQSLIYSIDSVSYKGYFLKVKLESLTDSIYGMNKSAFYSSGFENTDSSIVQDYIRKLVNKINLIETDKFGLILSVEIDSTIKEISYGYLPQIAGIIPLSFKTGGVIDFFSRYSIPQFEKNSQWKDYSSIDNNKSEADFKLTYLDDKVTTVEYSIETKEKYANTNSNGAELADRNSGIVKERIKQSRVSEYVLINNSLIAVNRSIAYNESYFLVQ